MYFSLAFIRNMRDGGMETPVFADHSFQLLHQRRMSLRQGFKVIEHGVDYQRQHEDDQKLHGQRHEP